ncbi:MAG TPA: DNA gyrase subunit B [Candidatus Azoamicus sp.]
MKKYNASAIKVYEGLSAVRKRPGMYIGNTDDGSGLHRLIFEVVDNSVDEALSGFCSTIKIIIRSNGFVSISDNGRGIPIDFYSSENKSAAEVIMTILHSGAKFDEHTYKISGGLHGVGISVVNALSKNLRLRIFRSGFLYEQMYFEGKPLRCLKIVSHSDKRGTDIAFMPDDSIFLITNFNYNTLLFRLKELSLLNSNLNFLLIDYRKKNIKYNLLSSDGGLRKFLYILNQNKSLVHEDIICFFGKFKDISFKVVFQWVHTFREYILCYTNNIYQKNGGTHLVGFKYSLIKALKFYLENSFLNQNNLFIHSDDIKDGLIAIVSIYMKNPKFSSQIKDKLISLEAKKVLENIIYIKFKKFLYENPIISKLILNKIFLSAKTREAIKKAKELSLNKQVFENISLFSKLSDCQETNPVLSELYLVEGDSAGGSAKQARDRKTQAILPLKGKILNVEKAEFEKITSNSEIISLINALNCGVGKNNYDEKKLRYHKIILMTDADIDGAHIRTLLMTFFYRYMPKLIENEHVFISRSPLYKFLKGNKSFYIKDKHHLDDFLFDSIFSELSNSNNLDNKLLKVVLDNYRLYLNIIENYSYKFPIFFIDKLMHLSNENFDLNYDHNSNTLSKLNNVFNKFNDERLMYHFLSFSDEKKSFKLFIKLFGFSKEYNFNYDFFFSNEFKFIKLFYSNLKQLYLKTNLFFGKTFYDLYNFSNLVKDVTKKIISGYTIQRYKGLGEMNPSQLWETTMNPQTRNLQLITIKDFNYANNIFSNLMGDNIINRKKMIYKHARSVSDFDF